MSEFTPDNAAMLLIDHQTGIMSWAKSIPPVELVRNTRALARVAKALAMPTVLTTSMEDRPGQGKLMKDLEEILPDEYARRVKRLGVVDCLDDPNYAAAVKQTGRKNLIMAGVTNDVCIVFPARRAVREGYQVQVVVDAGGSPTKLADDIALRRMEKAGVQLTSTNQLIAELAKNWSSPHGGKLVEILFEEVLSKL